MWIQCDYISIPVWGSTIKASLGSSHFAIVEECSMWMAERWVSGGSNQAQMSVSMTQAISRDRTQRKSPQWGSQELDVNNLLLSAHQAWLHLCPFHWGSVCGGSWNPTWSFVSPLSEVILGHRCASPTASQQRR